MRVSPRIRRDQKAKAAENVHDLFVQLLDGFPRTLVVRFDVESLKVILQSLDLGLKTTAIDRG